MARYCTREIQLFSSRHLVHLSSQTLDLQGAEYVFPIFPACCLLYLWSYYKKDRYAVNNRNARHRCDTQWPLQDINFMCIDKNSVVSFKTVKGKLNHTYIPFPIFLMLTVIFLKTGLSSGLSFQQCTIRLRQSLLQAFSGTFGRKGGFETTAILARISNWKDNTTTAYIWNELTCYAS